MKFRKNKKGFTIIELVIVVAVIGILAAVLIPTFINLKNEADRAAQQSNLYNANLTLRMHDANRSMSEAVKLLKDFGYDTEGLFSRETEDPILYHLNENQFVHESAIPSGANKYEYWKMQSTFTGSEQYSVYAMRDFKIVDQFDSDKEADEQEYAINNLKVGFDVGENLTIKSIDYDRSGESSKITAVIVTNSTTYEEEQANLTINAYVNGDDCDTIYHYGKAGYVHVINSGNHSFHTGARVGAAVVDSGRFVAGQGAKVSKAVATSADATFAKEGNGQYLDTPYATSDEVKNAYNSDKTKGDKVDLQYDSTKGETPAAIVENLVEEGIDDVVPATVKVVEVYSSSDIMNNTSSAQFERDSKRFSVSYTVTENTVFNMHVTTELHGLFGVAEDIECTINLNGFEFKVIDYSIDSDIDGELDTIIAIQLAPGSHLTFNDSVGTGGFKMSSYIMSGPNWYCIFFVDSTATLTLNGGTYYNKEMELLGGSPMCHTLIRKNGVINIYPGTSYDLNHVVGTTGTINDYR